MEIFVGAPRDFSKIERDFFSELVLQGGEVASNALATNIKNAKALVFAREGNQILGIAALKCPQTSYRKNIGRKAGVEIAAPDYPYELGYVYVVPEAQGNRLSHCLVAAALAHADRWAVFATTRTDNAAMLVTLAKAGFAQMGEDYSGRHSRTIRLLVKR